MGHPGTSALMAILTETYYITGLKSFLKELSRKCVKCKRASSVNSGSVLRAGKLVKCIQDVCEQFEKETRHEVRSTKHNVPNFGKDFDDVIKTLSEENIFVPISDRQHESFSFKCGILQKLSHTELLKKANHSIQQLI